MRKIVYEVETAHYGGKNRNKHKKNRNEEWVHEKRSIALRTINNASVLIDVVHTMKAELEKHPDSSLKDAINKIDSVIEEMKVDFKKNYTL